ncbi:MAG: AAA family ATPase [Chloroflexi bacterium]|nr:AAA family ATPase [Chloroflexota bacterium]
MTLHIRTLGPFQAQRGDSPIPNADWKTQKNKALFKILLTFRGHSLTREQLMEWLWPDLDPDAASRSLRVAVSQLRQALEPELAHGSQSNFIRTTDAGYAWHIGSDYWLDVDEFERLAGGPPPTANVRSPADGIRSLESALNLYSGDYLEEDRYADWATVERERLRERYLYLKTQLAEAYARQGRYRQAVRLCREVLAADPARESMWVQLMLYHYHAGDQALALRAFDECREVLARELDAGPLPETVALTEQIRRRAVTGPYDFPPPQQVERLRRLPLTLGHTPFVGREAEYATLIDLAQQARSGRGHIMLIEGEAGVGKTRLAEEALGYARQQGQRVLEGRCGPSAGLPYQPLLQPLRAALAERPQRDDGKYLAWLASLAELMPDVRRDRPNLPADPPVPQDQAQARLFDSLTGILFASVPQMVDTESTLLFLDDLHLADSATLKYLAYLAPGLAQMRISVLATGRSEEIGAGEPDDFSGFLSNLKRQRILLRVRLTSLSADAVARLLAELSGGSPQVMNLSERLYEESEGNPLFLTSILMAWFEEGRLAADETGRWFVEAAPAQAEAAMPPTMQAIIRRRLGRLHDGQRRVLEAASVLGHQFEWAALARVRVWRGDVLFDLLDGLVGALLLSEHGRDGYVFSHDKIRQFVYEGIGLEQRAWLHQRAGEALESLHPDRLDEVAASLAFHFGQAGAWDKTFDYHLRAGRHAQRLYALAQAESHFRAALALKGRDGFEPPESLLMQAHEGLGELLQSGGQFDEAIRHFESALSLAAIPEARVHLLHRLAHNYDRRGQRELARPLLRQAVDEADRLGAEQAGYLESARIYGRWAIFNSDQHGASGAEHYARRALDLIDRYWRQSLSPEGGLTHSEGIVVRNVFNNVGEAFRIFERWPEAAENYEKGLTVAERIGDEVGIGYSYFNLGDVVLAQGGFERASVLFKKAAEAFRRTGHVWEQMASFTHLGLTYLCEARWEQAAESLEQARAVGVTIEPTAWLVEVHLWLAIAILRHTGDRTQARFQVDQATKTAQSVGHPPPAGVWRLAESVFDSLSGDLDAARRHWADSQADFQTYAESYMCRRWILDNLRPD